MRANRWTGILCAATLLSASVLAGCGQEMTADPTGFVPAGNDGHQELNLPLSDEIPTLDVTRATDSLAFRILGQINEGLTRLDQRGKAIPGVAQSWTVSEDGLNYQFSLRADAKWSDGTAVTAHDFEYAWKRALDPKTNAQYAFMVAWVKGGNEYNIGKGTADDVQVRALGDHQLQVTLERPVPFFLEQLAFPVFYPLKQALVEQLGKEYAKEADALVSNGPFQVSSWVHEQTLQLIKNPHYWDQQNVRLDEVNFQVIKDPVAAENLYQSGQLDRIRLVREQFDRYQGQPEFRIQPELTNGYLQFNLRNKVLANANIRKALTYAIDAQQYVDIIYHNGTMPATGYVPTGTSDGQGGDFRKSSGDLMQRHANMARARDYLAQGLAELRLPELPKLTLLQDDSTLSQKSAEFLRAGWLQNLQVDVEIETVPFKLRLKRTSETDFDIVLSLWGADYNDPMTFLDMWTTDGPFNDAGYSSPRYDELIEMAKREPNSKRRMQALVEAEKTLLADMPVGPLFFRGYATATKPYVKGWVDMPFSPDFDLKHVSVDGK